MRYRLGFGMGFAAGYVMGSKAGRERYEQIRGASLRLWESDQGIRLRQSVQSAAGRATAAIRSNGAIDLTGRGAETSFGDADLHRVPNAAP